MKRYITIILCLLLILIITSCTSPPPAGPVRGKLYNACDGNCSYSGWTLKFYIDNVYTATIKAGKNYSTAVTAGWHTILVYHNQECLNASGYSMEIIDEGWYFYAGCEDGTHP